MLESPISYALSFIDPKVIFFSLFLGYFALYSAVNKDKNKWKALTDVDKVFFSLAIGYMIYLLLAYTLFFIRLGLYQIFYVDINIQQYIYLIGILLFIYLMWGKLINQEEKYLTGIIIIPFLLIILVVFFFLVIILSAFFHPAFNIVFSNLLFCILLLIIIWFFAYLIAKRLLKKVGMPLLEYKRIIGFLKNPKTFITLIVMTLLLAVVFHFFFFSYTNKHASTQDFEYNIDEIIRVNQFNTYATTEKIFVITKLGMSNWLSIKYDDTFKKDGLIELRFVGVNYNSVLSIKECSSGNSDIGVKRCILDNVTGNIIVLFDKDKFKINNITQINLFGIRRIDLNETKFSWNRKFISCNERNCTVMVNMTNNFGKVVRFIDYNWLFSFDELIGSLYCHNLTSISVTFPVNEEKYFKKNYDGTWYLNLHQFAADIKLQDNRITFKLNQLNEQTNVMLNITAEC